MENVINNIIWRAAMKKLSMTKMADTIISKRKELKMTQVQLAEATAEFIQAEKSGYAETLRYSETLSKQNFYCAVKLADGDILRVGRTTDSVFSTMLSSSLLLGGLLIVILAVAFVLVRRQTRDLIEPINTLDLEEPLKEVKYEELRGDQNHRFLSLIENVCKTKSCCIQSIVICCPDI